MVTMTQEKTTKSIELVKTCLAGEIITIRMIASVTGKIVATRPANRWAFLFTKHLEVEKNEALFENKFNYDAQMTLSTKSKSNMKWVVDNLASMSAPVMCALVDYVIYTDASNQGWGCYDAHTKLLSGGRWTYAEQKLHINCLELKAIHFAGRQATTGFRYIGI